MNPSNEHPNQRPSKDDPSKDDEAIDITLDQVDEFKAEGEAEYEKLRPGLDKIKPELRKVFYKAHFKHRKSKKYEDDMAKVIQQFLEEKKMIAPKQSDRYKVVTATACFRHLAKTLESDSLWLQTCGKFAGASSGMWEQMKEASMIFLQKANLILKKLMALIVPVIVVGVIAAIVAVAYRINPIGLVVFAVTAIIIGYFANTEPPTGRNGGDPVIQQA